MTVRSASGRLKQVILDMPFSMISLNQNLFPQAYTTADASVYYENHRATLTLSRKRIEKAKWFGPRI